MKLSVIALMLFSQVALASMQSVDIHHAHKNIQLDQAVYSLVPTKTEIRQIPNCQQESDHPCTEVVVLESKPMVQLFVEFTDGVYRDPESPKGFLTFNFELGEFDPIEVNELKLASPMWRLSGVRYRRNFARQHFVLTTQLVERTIQVVDVIRSRLCPVNGETGEPTPGCIEELVYKPAQTIMREVTVTTK